MPILAPTELAFYQSNALAVTHTTPVSGSSQPARTLVVVTAHVDGWTGNTLADTPGNTYTRTVEFSQGGATTVMVFWTIVAAGKEITTSTTWALTASGSAGCCMSVQAFTSIEPNPLDGSAAAGFAAGTDLNSGNTAALTGMDDLLIGACALNASGLTVTPEVLSPPWTGVTTNPLTNTVSSGIRRLYTFWREQTGGGTPRFDSTTSAAMTSCAAGIVAFKAITAAPFVPHRMPMGV